MADIIAVVRVSFINDEGKETTKDLITENGLALVIGAGKNGGARYEVPEKMSNADKSAAIAMDNYSSTPLGVELYNRVISATKEKAEELKSKETFDDAVKYLEGLSGEDFTELVIYSKINNNKFFTDVNVLKDVINADDAWNTSLINKAGKINKEVEQAVINVFSFDTDFIVTLRNKKNVTVEAKVEAYKAMFKNEYNKMIETYNELDRLIRLYRKFMTDIVK